MSDIFKLKMSDGKIIEYTPPPPSLWPSMYAFSVLKSGSTLFYHIIRDICVKANIASISLDDFLWNCGYTPHMIADGATQILSRPGYFYLGFRDYWCKNLDLSHSKCFFLMRDPRDAIVSHYFSLRSSHPSPGQGHGPANIEFNYKKAMSISMDLDSFVARKETVSFFQGIYQRYNDLILKNDIIIYRYEDVVYRKYEWICDIVKSIGVDLDHSSIQEILLKNDIRPQTEDVTKHIRQVSPGNFRHLLDIKTIELLNDKFYDVIRSFHYNTIPRLQLSQSKESLIFAPGIT